MHTSALRYWALRQFLHCVGLLAGKGYGFRDLWGAFRQDILQTFVRGHLNEQPFVCMEDEYPELRTRLFLDIARLEHIAQGALERLEKMDTERSGILKGYAAAQRRHLGSCDRCRRFACGVIINCAVETAKVRSIMKRADWT